MTSEQKANKLMALFILEAVCIVLGCLFPPLWFMAWIFACQVAAVSGCPTTDEKRR